MESFEETLYTLDGLDARVVMEKCAADSGSLKKSDFK